MVKRSDYDRIPKDKHQTPYKAVLPLIPDLRRDGIKSFAELCCEGQLIRHLESFGLGCVQFGDIKAGPNALQVKRYVGYPDVGITNPPYPDDAEKTTRLLRDPIRHFLTLGRPFWLLIYSDWMFNGNAAPFIPRCSTSSRLAAPSRFRIPSTAAAMRTPLGFVSTPIIAATPPNDRDMPAPVYQTAWRNRRRSKRLRPKPFSASSRRQPGRSPAFESK
jgi:hypothetical protein